MSTFTGPDQTAYWLPFEEDHSTHQFKPGTNFENVVNQYEFDRELRLHILDALERLEVSVRRQWAYYLGHIHGPHAHLDNSIHTNPMNFNSNLKKLEKEISRSNEVFIRHFSRKYQEKLPPVWASCEVMSLGLLSRWYSNLKPMQTSQAIASAYKLDQMVFQSWLHYFSLIRNICAHHGRLWNREFPIIPKLPRNPAILRGNFVYGSRRLFNGLLMLVYLLDIIVPGNRWCQKVFELLEKFQISFEELGAPRNWTQNPLWQAVAADP